MEQRADKLTVDDVVQAMMLAIDDEEMAGQGVFIHGRGKIGGWFDWPRTGNGLTAK